MTEGFSLQARRNTDSHRSLTKNRPVTRVTTYTAQSDLLFIRHAGQEVSRWLQPATPEEAMFLGAVAFRIAWEFQCLRYIN